MNAFAPFADPRNAFQRGAFGVSAGGGNTDPIAGLFSRLRLQTYLKQEDQILYLRPCTVIVGANSAPVNARYYRLDDYTWQTEDGAKKIVFSEVDYVWVITVNDNRYYVSGTGYDPTAGPAVVTQWYEDEVGSSPTPSSSYVDEPNYKPIGIPDTFPTAVAAWEDTISGTGQATQSGAIQRFLTGREAGVPVLLADGSDDWMETDIESSEVDSEGAFFAVFLPLAPLDFDTPVGGTSGGRALSCNFNISAWGVGSPGLYGPVDPININPIEWMSLAVSWQGNQARYRFITRNSGGTADVVIGGTVSSAPGNLGIGAHVTDDPYSYLQGSYIAVGIGDKYLTAEQLQQAAEYGATLFPPT